MRRLATASSIVIALALAVAFAFGPPPTPVAGLGSGAEVESGVVLLRLRPAADAARASAELAAEGVTNDGEIPQIRVRKLRVPAGREREFAARFAARPDVEFAEPSYVAHALWMPNDPFYSSQWGLTKIGAEQAWNVTRGSPTITVAVLDTGFDVGHPDSPANLVLGTDFIPPPDGTGTVTKDPVGHGTHVTGIIAAGTDNGVGVAGLAPNVTVLEERVLDQTGIGGYAGIAAAIIAAADAGARVISMSLGGTSSDYSLQSAVNYAIGKGVLVVAAAGNCGDPASAPYSASCNYTVDEPLYPAAYAGVLAVAATTASDTQASYSNTNSYVGIAAPGGDCASLSTNVLSLFTRTATQAPSCQYSSGTGYRALAGTSMATPFVSALAGLIWSRNSTLSADRVAGIIKTTANPLGPSVPNTQFGYGRIDAEAALAAVPPPTETFLPLVVGAP